MPVDPSNVQEFAKSGPVYMTLESYEESRKRLAGQRDYCLILGITVADKRADNGEPYIEQYPVIEVWDRNNQTFNTPREALELGIHLLGKTMGEVLDNYRFTWPVAADDFRTTRITGFSVQPGERQVDGSIEWDDYSEIWNTQCGEPIRQVLAFRRKGD